ncbi:unnamed protein product, partial [Didymodactylos carnosus]
MFGPAGLYSRQQDELNVFQRNKA